MAHRSVDTVISMRNYQSSFSPDRYKSYVTSPELLKPVVRRSHLPSGTTRKERYARCLTSPSLSLPSTISTSFLPSSILRNDTRNNLQSSNAILKNDTRKTSFLSSSIFRNDTTRNNLPLPSTVLGNDTTWNNRPLSNTVLRNDTIRNNRPLSSTVLRNDTTKKNLPLTSTVSRNDTRKNIPLPSTVLRNDDAAWNARYSANSYVAPVTLRSISPPRRWWKKLTTSCTPDQLLDIIREPVGYYALPSDPYNEVYPGIYLSDAPTAMCTSLLKRMGVSHVLNAAQGKERNAGQVNTWPGFYSHSRIKFHGVEAFDNIVFRLYPYFEESAQFIDDALDNEGKVLVHCRAGISRSATLVCAFLMLKRNMSAQEAVRTVRKHRAIIPNDGFLQQLCDLNESLGHREI